MGITNLLSNKRIMDEFSRKFSLPPQPNRCKIKASSLSKNSSTVGVAFDYLLRFYLERHNPTTSQDWVAEEWVDLLQLTPETLKTVRRIISAAKYQKNLFIRTGELTDDLIKSVLLLGKLDYVARSGGDLPAAFFIDENDITDLKNLFIAIPPKTFEHGEKCILNPTFGNASLMVGGADADFILGDILVDIKTIKDLVFTKKHLFQLVAYLILNRIGLIDGEKEKINIERLGIYYSRFGYLYSFNVTDIVKEKELKKFSNLFIDVVQGFQ